MRRAFQFAGSWYPPTLEEAESYWTPSEKRIEAKAVICPHAGWMYSGRIAGEVYGRLLPADTYVVLGPNHTGAGKASTSLYAHGEWTLPESSIPIDEPLAEALRGRSEFLSEDPEAHGREHSIEVQLPFLRLLNPKCKIVPIVMRDFDPEICQDLGRSLATAIKGASDRKILLVASTDMTHYEPSQAAISKDRIAIERILALDVAGLRRVVDRQGISMCGLGPAAAVLLAAKTLGASSAELVRYATSGDVTGDNDSVVGYAGIIVR